MENFESLKNEILNIPMTNSLGKIASKAKDQLKDLTLPHRRIETWKYTNLNSLFSKNFSVKNRASLAIQHSHDDSYYHVYDINGSLSFSDEVLSKFIEFTPLKSLEKENILNHVNSDQFYQDDFLNILTNANSHDGFFIKIKDNASLDKPIMIHHHYAGNLSFHNCQYLFEVGKNAKVQFACNLSSMDEVVTNIKYTMHLKQGAQLEHLVLQNSNLDSFSFVQINAQVERDADYNNCFINMGSKLSRNNIFINLFGENATGHANGLYLQKDQQHHDTNCYIKHSSAHTYSNQLYKGIMNDESRGVFAGIIRIDKDSQLVNSHQLNKNLLLSDKAQANSRPQLEIYADDVKCAHGSTTGQLSMDELFYFQARGINEKKAKSMLTHAFINDVILKIENKTLQTTARDMTENYQVSIL